MRLWGRKEARKTGGRGKGRGEDEMGTDWMVDVFCSFVCWGNEGKSVNMCGGGNVVMCM